MRVSVHGQRVVPPRVLILAPRAEVPGELHGERRHQLRHLVRVGGLFLQALQGQVEGPGRRGVDVDPLLPGELLQLPHLSLVRLRVASKHGPVRVRVGDESRHRVVRHQHPLLHQLVTLPDDVRAGPAGVTRVGINLERKLALIQSDRATLEPPPPHRSSRGVQQTDSLRHRRWIPRPGSAILGANLDGARGVVHRLQKLVYAGTTLVPSLDDPLSDTVVQFCARLDDAAAEPLALDDPVWRHLPFHAERQTLHPGVKRA